MNNEENNVNVNVQNSSDVLKQNNYEKVSKKTKIKWFIPVLFFLIGLVIKIANSTMYLLFNNQLSMDEWATNSISKTLNMLSMICWLLVIPSLIVVIIKRNNKDKDVLNQTLTIGNTSTLDEKLLMAYIGNNYQKIMKKNFSIPAFFLSWGYILYRKLYLPAILGMTVIMFLSFLPEQIYLLLIFAILFVIGFGFNKFYIYTVNNNINKIKKENQNATESELINICQKNGGTNILLAIVIFLIFSIISNLVNNLIDTSSFNVNHDNNNIVVKLV